MCKQRCIATLSGTDGTCHTMVLLTLFRCSGGSGKPTASSAMRQLGCNDFFFGLDAPTTARTVGLPPRRGEYFLSKRKKVPKKACGTALREKGFYCPFWRRGSQCRAQWSWTAFTSFWSALVLAFFRRQNGRAFFPPLPIAALLPRSWRWADSTNASWDVTAQVGWLRCIHKQTCFPTHSWRWTYLTGAAWDTSMRLGWFRSAKNRLDFFLLPLALSMLNQRRLG